jgi:hypothetical protein
MQGLRVTSHVAKVSDAAQLEPFRDEVADRHCTEKIHLLFSNPGIGGGMIAHAHDEWERTFNIGPSTYPDAAALGRLCVYPRQGFFFQSQVGMIASVDCNDGLCP